MLMKRKVLIYLLAAVFFLPLAPLPAEAAETNNGAGFISHDELKRQLNQIEKTSKGLVDVEVAGYSNHGREIHTARVGNGDTVILIQSEIHGNEKLGTTALLNMLQQLGSNNSPEMRTLRDELTIVAMPMINPDATELFRRGNEMTWSEVVEQFPQLQTARPSWNYYTYKNQYWDYQSNPGFDVNRDFNPNLDYVPAPQDFPGRSELPGWYITPESQTVRDVYKSLQSEFGNVDAFIDLHHQGEYVIKDTDKPVTLSLSGVFVPHPDTAEGSKYRQYADQYNVEFSKQLNVAAYNALQTMGNSPFGNVSLYPQDLDLPGTALGSFALNGSGAVLYEITGQTHNYGQKKMGQLSKAVERSVFGILNSVATGEVYELDPEDYYQIPLTER
ncbi:MAG: M14 family zinc carboxypeptidase [Bacillus sp. (in: firmicutes)]